MGIYLGQLPPAEIARFKAELAETLIANFCYPRFFDHRTESLQMRPVDRTKRQDVWLYLSSFDFTAWSRVDLMSPDFQLQIERLFIQFVQRNRSFFGNQGRRRMSDVRALISSCATTVTESLRNYLTGQRSTNPPFGSPRPVLSWGASAVSGKPPLAWDQISAPTMVLQQQLQELRGEPRTSSTNDSRPAPAQGVPAGNSRRATSARIQSPVLPASNGSSLGSAEFDSIVTQQPTVPTVPVGQRVAAAHAPERSAASASEPSGTLARKSEALASPSQSSAPVARRKSQPLSLPADAPVPSRKSGIPVPPAEQVVPTRKSEPLVATVTPFVVNTAAAAPAPVKVSAGRGSTTSLADGAGTGPVSSASRPTPAGSVPAKGVTASANATGRDVMSVGEDDVAIFEQMRHQLLLWLRVEAVTAGLEISGQSPSQLLEMLRQQSRFDETRLQVVSTLLNLANQVIKTGMVSALDYKQALMFHLMHTRRS